MPSTGVTEDRLTLLIWAFGLGAALMMIGMWLRRHARTVRKRAHNS
jgi:cytochrome c-type biogenesis protein CcmH/NrfF